MPRISRDDKVKSSLFTELEKAKREFNEKDDCAVIALAAAAQCSYADAHAALKRAGRKDRDGTYLGQVENALETFGLKLRRLSETEKDAKVLQYPGVHKNLKSITTHHPARFPDAWRDGKTYLFMPRGHFTLIRNGVNHDWSKGHSLRAISIFEVIAL